jgi:hypothetical protein
MLNDQTCFIGFLESFEVSFTTMFTVRLVKEFMSIMLLSNIFYEKWKEILLLWEQGKILDGYGKLPSRPQPMGKSTFNRLVGLKEFHMVKFVHGLKAHEILLQNQPMAKGTRTS